MQQLRRRRVLEVCKLVFAILAVNGVVATQHVRDGGFNVVTSGSAGAFGAGVPHGIYAAPMCPAIFDRRNIACCCECFAMVAGDFCRHFSLAFKIGKIKVFAHVSVVAIHVWA